MDSVDKHRRHFLETCISASVLQFGSFKLKSGRQSPYFFNAGLLHRGDLVRAVSMAYAETIASYSPALELDIVFGPAYKGIPLAVLAVDKLADMDPERFRHVSYTFDRKETKQHGDGGDLVGAPLRGKRVVIVDDVITAGTAIRHAIDLIRQQEGTLVAIVVALDRMEKAPMFDQQAKQIQADEHDGHDTPPQPSAIAQVRREFGVPVLPILTLDDIIDKSTGIISADDSQRLKEYRDKYKASD